MTLRKQGPPEGRDAHMGLLKSASPVETPSFVPCHRIVGTDEPASSGRGDETRARVLALEGVEAR